MMSILSPTISKGTLQALTELTGEPRLNVALPIALQDAVAHRLEKVNVAIRALEQKYGMSFDQFQAQGEEENVQSQFSYEVENDYLEWDGLVSRKMKLERIEQWLV